MSDIKAFLQPPVMDETEKVIVSKRFKGADGKAAPFVIRVIDQETNDRLIKQATKHTKANGQVLQELDNVKYGKLLIAACVVEPNFKDSELCAYYKTMDPLDVPGRMLSSGEYKRLVQAINRLNGFTASDEEYAELEEEAKN
ncbi:hypothetical protein [Clostridium sp. AM58-1XD]|uniref:phage tail assembly chaperone n=1 Tax=Clostridium sp. AM58-1XD TaxID=2292307 RepID=UPI000E493CD9|nr:hypothetical protein [Clostridium sp. AM58-1XD]RGY97269.1 hypothetical protein DXA13_15120 [Clostridium sp. AM58-1XD]